MPRFDFSCENNHELETKSDVILKVTHTLADYPHCTQCGNRMDKVPSRFNPQFVGEGFHRTDYNAPTRGY